MRKVIIITVIICCVFSLSSLVLGTTLDGLFTGANNQNDASEYGQFTESLENILGWFTGLGDFFRGALDFLRTTGVALANAWEAVELWFSQIGEAIITTLNNIMEFFGWVNNDNPSRGERSAFRCVSQRAESEVLKCFLKL